MVAEVIVFVLGLLMGLLVKKYIIYAVQVLTGYLYFRKQKEATLSLLISFIKVKEQYMYYKKKYKSFPRTYMQYIGFVNKHITVETVHQTYKSSVKEAVILLLVFTFVFIGFPFVIFQDLYMYFFLGTVITLVYEYVYETKFNDYSHMFMLSAQIDSTLQSEWLRLHPPKEIPVVADAPAETPGGILQEEIVFDAAIFKTKLFKYIKLTAIAGSVLFVVSIVGIFLVAIYLSNSTDDTVYTDATMLALLGYVLFMIALFLVLIIGAIANGVHSLLSNTKK